MVAHSKALIVYCVVICYGDYYCRTFSDMDAVACLNKLTLSDMLGDLIREASNMVPAASENMLKS